MSREYELKLNTNDSRNTLDSILCVPDMLCKLKIFSLNRTQSAMATFQISKSNLNWRFKKILMSWDNIKISHFRGIFTLKHCTLTFKY